MHWKGCSILLHTRNLNLNAKSQPGNENWKTAAPAGCNGCPVIDKQVLELLPSNGGTMFCCVQLWKMRWKASKLKIDCIDPVSTRADNCTPVKLQETRGWQGTRARGATEVVPKAKVVGCSSLQPNSEASPESLKETYDLVVDVDQNLAEINQSYSHSSVDDGPSHCKGYISALSDVCRNSGRYDQVHHRRNSEQKNQDDEEAWQKMVDEQLMTKLQRSN